MNKADNRLNNANKWTELNVRQNLLLWTLSNTLLDIDAQLQDYKNKMNAHDISITN